MSRYIGARYVPIMGGAWDNTKEYEPLVVVQYEGDSYTSKKYVPVGISITNTAYWVKTGNFNQQLAYINERMQDAEQEIDNIQGDINDILGDIAGIPDLFVTDSAYKEFTVATGATASGSIALSKPGYKPLALVGWSTSIFTLRDVSVGANAVSYTVTNNHETQTTGELNVVILFIKE